MMTNETQDLQYAGRRRTPSEDEVQAAGRIAASAVTPFTPPGYPQPNYPQLGYTPSPVKRRSSKRLVIGIIVSFVLLASAAGIIAGISGNRQTPGNTPDLGTPPAAVSVTPPAVTAPAAPDEPATPQRVVGDGEFLYSGQLELENVGDFKLSFVLSADLSYIRDIAIEIKDLEASAQSGNMTTTVTVSSMTETYSGEYPVDFERGSYEIGLGRNVIVDLFFFENVATVDFYYVYHSTGTGGGSDIDIPIGIAYGELTTGTAPVTEMPFTPEQPATPEEPSAPSTQTIFDYDKLKNWNDELSGSDFNPAYPEPRYYIVCASTVIDPVTGRESEGGYGHDYSRHKPVDTDDVLRRSGYLMDGGLILTDDPDRATFALIVTFEYDHKADFNNV